MAGPVSPQAHLDALARQLGYHDYATYQAYQRNRNALLGAGVTLQKPVVNPGAAQQPVVQPGQQPAPQNWLQRLIGALNGHP
jgi:hypothetical protein